jgi:hypothetical protein
VVAALAVVAASVIGTPPPLPGTDGGLGSPALPSSPAGWVLAAVAVVVLTLLIVLVAVADDRPDDAG